MATDYEKKILAEHSNPRLARNECTPEEHYSRLRGKGYSRQAALEIISSSVREPVQAQPSEPERELASQALVRQPEPVAPPPPSEPPGDHERQCLPSPLQLPKSPSPRGAVAAAREWFRQWTPARRPE